ncbi:MAG: type II secretion system protein GspG [Planctomycetota bacterium]
MNRTRVSRRSPRAGFTLIEMIVVVAIIVSLAGIIIPVVSSEIEDAKTARAVGDLNRIATAITQYIKDTGTFPTGTLGAQSFTWAHSNADIPESNSFDDGLSEELARFLSLDIHGGDRWRGPYCEEIGADPWGRAYLVNVHGYYSATEHVLVLSAGPNGEVETDPTAIIADGDDVAVLID